MAVSIEEQFRAGLVADTGVSALVAGRWYIDQLPQNPTFPCGIIQRISDVPFYAQQAPGGSQATFGWARINVTVWCDGPNASQVREDLARAIILATQTFSCSEAGGRQAPNILLNRRHGVDPQPRQPLFKAMLDFRVAYQFQ